MELPQFIKFCTDKGFDPVLSSFQRVPSHIFLKYRRTYSGHIHFVYSIGEVESMGEESLDIQLTTWMVENLF